MSKPEERKEEYLIMSALLEEIRQIKEILKKEAAAGETRQSETAPGELRVFL